MTIAGGPTHRLWENEELTLKETQPFYGDMFVECCFKKEPYANHVFLNCVFDRCTFDPPFIVDDPNSWPELKRYNCQVLLR